MPLNEGKGRNDDPKNELKPGFHMIARIAGDARIAQICDQRSLHQMETVLFSLPAIVALPVILAFEMEIFLSLRS